MWRCEVIAMLLLACIFVGCSGSMADQPRYETFEESDLFANEMSARPLVANVVPRNAIIEDTVLRTGLNSDGEPTSDFPLEVNRQLLERGRQRYDIYCTPCHGYSGAGDGMIVERGFPAPPSFQSERLLSTPNGHYFDVMTNGFGVMYDYSARVSVEDRWAIVAYIRALQLSQNVPVETLPEAEREQLSP